MKMRRNSITAIIVTLALGLVVFISLAMPRRNTTIGNQPPIRQQLNYEGKSIRLNKIVATPRPGNTPQNVIAVEKQKSDNINKNLMKMKELSKVGVIVVGNTALVGYSPSKSATNVVSTKNLITNRVKQLDRSIKTVVVSESADFMSRLNKLTTDITKKRPANEISNEINQLIKGASPLIK